MSVEFRTDTREYLPVAWEATIPLGGQTVEIGLRSLRSATYPEQFFAATWAGSASTSFVKSDGSTWFRRECRVLIGPGGPPSVGAFVAGRYMVSTRLTDSPEIPAEDAFTLTLKAV